MKILAFDTSSYSCSVAIQHGDDIRSLDQPIPMQQAKFILPMIQELLKASSLSLSQLNAIAFGCGPGSFTGIRIASSVAQGLGLVTGLPLISVSSLAALAQTAYLTEQRKKLLVSIQARMNQVYFAAYQVNQRDCVELVGKEEILFLDQLPLPLEPDWYGIGNGWLNYNNRGVAHLPLHAINPSLSLNARAVLMLAQIKFEQGDWGNAFLAHPCYLT